MAKVAEINEQDTLHARFARRLIGLRKKKDLTQPELAKAAGVGFRSVTRWEAGEEIPSFANLTKLGAFFGTTPAKLIK